jgi:hypothetical protein
MRERLAIWSPTPASLSNLRAQYLTVACGGGLRLHSSRGDLLGNGTRGKSRHSLRPALEQLPTMARALAPCSSAFKARPCAPRRLASAHVLPAAGSGLVQRRGAAVLAGEIARRQLQLAMRLPRPAAHSATALPPAEPAVTATLGPRRRCLRVCADAAAAAPREPSGQLKDSR